MGGPVTAHKPSTNEQERNMPHRTPEPTPKAPKPTKPPRTKPTEPVRIPARPPKPPRRPGGR